MYSKLIWSVFSRIRTEYRQMQNISRFQSKCGKIRTRITPNTDTFYAVWQICCKIHCMNFLHSLVFISYHIYLEINGMLIKKTRTWKWNVRFLEKNGEWCSHQRRIQKPGKRLRWIKLFAKIINGWKVINYFCKKFHLWCLAWFWMRLW